jgi:hypothetical protein
MLTFISKRKTVLPICIGLACCSVALAGTQAVPSVFATDEAPNSMSLGDPGTRMQIVYDSSLFSNFPDGAEITAIRFRVDTPAGFAFSGIWDVELHLSTSSVSDQNLSSMFAANVGPDETISLPRSTISIQSDYASQGPNSLSVVIQLPNHFHYSPSKGDLLLDFRNFNRSGVPAVPFYDAASAFGGGMAYIRAGINSTISTEGARFTGPVMAVDFITVPEPSGLFGISMVVGVSLFLFRRYVTA